MNDIVTYTNEIFGTLRVLDIDNQPWFIGKEVAEKLGYKDVNRAVKQHVDKEDLKACDYKGYGDLYPTLWSNENDFVIITLVNS